MTTLKETGSLAFSEIEDEFSLSADAQLGINEFYDADPYHEVPASGTISVNNFFGTSRQTCALTPGRSSDTVKRYGYSAYQGSSYYVSESGESSAAFGSISRTTSLHSASKNVSGIVAEIPAGYYYPGGIGAGMNIVIAINNNSNVTGFDDCYFYTDAMKQPTSAASLTNYEYEVDEYTHNNGASAPSTYSVATEEDIVYNFPSEFYGIRPGDPNYTLGTHPTYMTASLSNTSPTAYAMHFTPLYSSWYIFQNNAWYVGHRRKYMHLCNMLYANSNSTYGTQDVYIYFDG